MTLHLGLIGLGKMGGNMVHRIKRDSDHDVVAFDFDDEAVRRAEETSAEKMGKLTAGMPMPPGMKFPF